MSFTASTPLSVTALFAERDARRQRDKKAEEKLLRNQQEGLSDFRNRLERFQLLTRHANT